MIRDLYDRSIVAYKDWHQPDSQPFLGLFTFSSPERESFLHRLFSRRKPPPSGGRRHRVSEGGEGCANLYFALS